MGLLGTLIIFPAMLLSAAQIPVSFGESAAASPEIDWSLHVFQNAEAVAADLEHHVETAIATGDCSELMYWRDYAESRQRVDLIEGRQPSDQLLSYIDHFASDAQLGCVTRP